MAKRREPEEIVGVYEDEDAARSAADDVRAGPGSADVRVGGSADERASLRGEMREELEHTTVGVGNVGPFTKEMRRGLPLGIPLWTVVGALVGLGLGALIPIGETRLLVRLIIGGISGAVAGATLGFIVGGGLGPRFAQAGESLAAERGVTVGVTSDDPDEAAEAVERLRGHDPVRLDRATADGRPLGTETTEEDRDAG